jgi:hypothetical protein
MTLKEEMVVIKVSRETRERLKQLGRKVETYDDIIKKLLRSVKLEKIVVISFEKTNEPNNQKKFFTRTISKMY